MKKITVINNAIRDAISIVAAKAKKSLEEPDYNAAMAIELPPLVNASGVFPGVKFGGCFIHQSPKVTFAGKYANPSTCEVGDLLVICHDVVDGDDRYNAALIQWKKLTSGVEKITGSALKQLDLYENWPLFTLNSCGCQFDIHPKTVTPGAQYGLILPSAQTSLFCTIPAITLKTADSPSFARFIINLMKWQTGRPFVLDVKQKGQDSWSDLILHLLFVSLSKRFNRKNVGYADWPRASKDLLEMLVDDKDGKDGIEVQHIEKEDLDDGSISILYVEMGEGKEVKANPEEGIRGLKEER